MIVFLYKFILFATVSQRSTTNTSTDLYYNASPPSASENCHQCVPVISVTGNVASNNIQNTVILDGCDIQASGSNLDARSGKLFEIMGATRTEGNRKINKTSFQPYRNDLISLPKSPDSVIE